MSRRQTKKRDSANLSSEITKTCIKKPKTTDVEHLKVAANVIKTVFGMEMPEDFFLFWKFCKRISSTDPLHAIPGLKLVGPFQIMQDMSQFKDISEVSMKHLLDHRFYFDPPELLTVIVSMKNTYHIGIFRDDEHVKSCIYVSNTGKSSKLTILGDNILAAVMQYFQDQSSKGTVQQKLARFAKESNYCLDASSDIVNDRKRRIVAKAFHGAGIVVPVQNNVGYRPVGGSYAKWEKLFTRIDNAPSDDERRILFGDIQETLTCIQFANDECDYGMGLELGMNMFCHGSRYLNKTSVRLLTMAYKLLKRDLYARIIEEHLKNR